MTEPLRAAIRAAMPAARADLERLIRIPSVAFPGFPSEPVRAAADATREILAAAGYQGARLIEIPGGQPAVYAEIPPPPGAPTVLLYAHYDVQPAGDWPEAFTPVERDGRLRGRGAADDKAGIIMHALAARAYDGRPPVGIKVIVEGEEETGASRLEATLSDYRDLLRADAIVVADAGNWKLGVPTLTTTLRGVVKAVVEVRALEKAVHSGLFGGPAPDALIALVKMLSALYDDEGNTVLPGLAREPWEGLDYPEEEFRRQAGVLPGVALAGSGTLSEQLWTSPSAAIIGLDAPRVEGAGNALVPAARAAIALRIPPRQDPQEAFHLLAQHLRAVAPWQVQVDIRCEGVGAGFAVDTAAPAFAAARRALERAYGQPAVLMGSGGSIPLIPALAAAFPGAAIVLWGVEDPEAGIHGPNEGVDLAELERMALAEALFLEELAAAS
ncbi:MAG: M20/M25/M40 family metallo-hydrolase [Chloroflexota bacterium]|nr:M20/M25/M40 family metallo-hydrolase [Dehalococcoidia bacterium]MDW8254986.1 M20/M25/M40 family metallo-hydrolase [Chloroflexota bacterium]